MALNSVGNPYIDFFKGFFVWSLPLKLVVSAFLGVFSAGVLGWLSEYATYSYSVYYGVRPAVEGVPYLAASVALGSFLILMLTAIAFGLSYLFIRILFPDFWLKVFFRNDGREVLKHVPFFETKSNFLAILGALFLVGVIWTSMFVTAYFKNSLHDFKENWIVISVLFIFSFFSTLASLRPHWLPRIAMGVALLNMVFWCVIMFSPQVYAKYLRIVGHGGGYPAVLELDDGGKLDIYLFLRTSHSYLVLSADAKKVIEIPKLRVNSLEHGLAALHGVEYILPPGGWR